MPNFDLRADTAMHPDQYDDGLTMPERAMLTATSAAEKMGLGGAAVRIYNDVVQRGRTSPITEKDFSDSELKAFQSFVSDYVDRTGKKAGHLDYKDYPPNGSVDENILGGFDYKMNDRGGITITDKYKFNSGRASAYDNNVWAQALGFFANPRGLAAEIGRKRVSEKSGRAVPVSIQIGPQ